MKTGYYLSPTPALPITVQEYNPKHPKSANLRALFSSFRLVHCLMVLSRLSSCLHRLWHRVGHMTYRRRMLLYFCLFVYHVVQLSLFQSQHKDYDGVTKVDSDSGSDTDYITTLDTFLLLASLLTFCMGWVMRPVFETHVLTFNSVIIGLWVAWLVVSGPHIRDYYTSYCITAALLLYVGCADCYTLAILPSEVISVRRSSPNRQSKSGILYDNLQGQEVAGDEVFCYPPMPLQTKGLLSQGFRVNLGVVPLQDAAKVPTQLSFSMFTAVTHLVDSSSCHIYTALWDNVPVVLKLIKEDRIKNAVAVAEFDAEEQVSALSPPLFSANCP